MIGLFVTDHSDPYQPKDILICTYDSYEDIPKNLLNDLLKERKEYKLRELSTDYFNTTCGFKNIDDFYNYLQKIFKETY